MSVANRELGQTPVPPDARQAFVGAGVPGVQSQRVIEVTVRAIQDSKLTVPLGDETVALGGRRGEDQQQIGRERRITSLQRLGGLFRALRLRIGAHVPQLLDVLRERCVG